MKDLLMQLQDVCNELKDKNEIAIMREYNCNAKRFTIALISKIIFLDFYVHLHFFYLTHELSKFQWKKKLIPIEYNNISAYL